MSDSLMSRCAVLLSLCSLANGVCRAQEAKQNDGQRAARGWKLRLDIPLSKGLGAQPGLRLFGADLGSELVHVEPQGLRLRLPVGRDGVDDVGVVLEKKMGGDFEITLAYELIVLPVPG